MACRQERFLLSIVTVAKETNTGSPSFPHTIQTKSHMSQMEMCLQVSACAFAQASVSVVKHRTLHLTLERHNRKETSQNPPTLNSYVKNNSKSKLKTVNLDVFKFGSL